jgi:RNA polymerase sporulation-specific sigma factor
MGGEKWDQKALLSRAAAGDEDAVNELVQKNLGLVHSVVKKFSNSPYEAEDLFQIGCMGLLKAIHKFDLSYDVRFSTYAVPMILGEIKRFLRDDGPVKVSRGLKELAIKAKSISELLQKQTGTAPGIEELASMLGRSAEEVVLALDAAVPPESLYGGGDEDGGVSAIDKIAQKGGGEGELVDKIALREVIGKLKARERQIIIFRYFQNKTQSEVAKILGISQVQVSRLEKKILEQMRLEMAV